MGESIHRARHRRFCPAWLVPGLIFALAASALPRATADDLRVLPAGDRPDDRRLDALKDLNGFFPFTPPTDRAAWEERAEALQRQLRVALGLWPAPTRTPLSAVVHGRVDRGDYTVERVFFESYPGHFVTGSLYRPKATEGAQKATEGAPKATEGKRPAVLCPHGHFNEGRFHDHGRDEVRRQIVQGAERFEKSGRHPIQARCVQLARMGCVVFQYDMLGYADSRQIDFQVAHRYGKPRPEMEGTASWGLFSPQAELRMQSVMGIQTYNSIRAVDWIASLPDVDPARIAVTGASGGGTQTFLLAAVDPRVAVAFPAVMVSTAMQGGCTCETASLLRVGTGNIEIAGLIAPRPLGLTAADDWTREMETKGFPELQSLYALLGHKDRVRLWPLVHFKHNYNYVSRAAMYAFLNRHLRLGHEEPIVEEDFEPLSVAEMTVWDDAHPAPPDAYEHERRLLGWMTHDALRQLDALVPKAAARDAAKVRAYRDVVGGAWETLVGRGLPAPGEVVREKIDKTDLGDHWRFKELLRFTPADEELPAVFLHPKTWNGQVVVWISGRGKESLLGADGDLREEVRLLLAGGVSVASVDLLYQGEFLPAGAEPPTETRKVENPRLAATYTHGYNHSLLARRAHDVLTLLAYIRDDEHAPKAIQLLGVEGAGPVVALARARAGDLVARTAVDTAGFRFAAIDSWRDVNFIPGAVKYGDLPGALSLAAPHPLLILGEPRAPRAVAACYAAEGAVERLRVDATTGDAAIATAARWLLEP